MATTAFLQDNMIDRSRCMTVAPVSTRNKCVLLIEDSKDAMFIVRYALKEHGRGKYRMVWAKSLSDGLSMLLKGGIDVVLLDLGLPDSSGPTTYAWVRETAPEVPVIVLTGDTREETELSAFAGGAEDFLVKEFVSGSRLVSTIEAVLGREGSGKEE